MNKRPSPLMMVSSCRCDGNNKNCSDFYTQERAQACYVKCMDEVGRDVHSLDGSSGVPNVACENLP